MMTIQKYVRAQSIEEAWQLNQSRGSRILGGMMWMRLSAGQIHTAIDLCDLGLDQIEETEDAFSIGAMASLRALEKHPGINAYTGGAAARAVADIVGVQFRNMATVGGSIWGRFGFSDVLTLFLALDAQVELYKGGSVPLEEFVEMKKDNDVLLRLIVKKTTGKVAYAAMRNQRTDFPVLACAVSCMAGEYRVAIGARPGRAMLLRAPQEMMAQGISEESAKALGEYAAAHIPTGSNVRGSAAYRTRLVRVLTERAVRELGGI